jgi:hypothetical protein
VIDTVRGHLEAALDAADPAEKNFHARQALQLLVDVEEEP